MAAVIGVVALVAVLASGWRLHARNAGVARSVPPQPTALAERPLLAPQIAAAEARARGTWASVAGLAQLGRLYHANGFLAEASLIWEGLERLDPKNPRWPYLQSTLLAGYGRFDVAIPALERTLARAPDYLPAGLHLGEALLKSGRTAEATATFSAILMREPTNSYAQLGLARIDFAARRWPEAQARLERIISARPDFSPAWSLLTTVYEQTGASVAASAARAHSMNSGLGTMPDPWVDELMEDCYDNYRLNVAAAAATDPVAAIRLLQRAIEIDSTNAMSHRLLGEQFSQTGDQAGARRELECATELDPGGDRHWLLLLQVLQSAGDENAYDATLRRGLTHCPQSPGLLLEKSNRLAAAGQYSAAIAVLQQLRHLNPDEAEYGVKVALLRFRLGEVDTAIAEMRDVLAKKPAHPLALLVVTRFAIESGDEVAARELLARIQAQPEILPRDQQALLAQYRGQFGHSP